MVVSVATLSASLEDLGESLASALLDLNPEIDSAALGDSHITLIGPFPAYVVGSREFLKTGLESAERSGWRALAELDGQPLSVVDISFLPDGDVTYSHRGADAADAFSAVLAAAAGAAAAAETFEVRWLSLPDIYVTALWLEGEVARFLPTRLGAFQRPDVGTVDLSSLQRTVAPLYAVARSGDAAATRGSPRSGLPD